MAGPPPLPDAIAAIDLGASSEDVPLKELFARAHAVARAVEDVPFSHPALPDVVSAACTWLAECGRLVDTLALFSSNEEADEIATGDLKYLLVPFLRAEALARVPITDPMPRRENLESALHHYGAFLAAADGYGLLGEVAGKSYASSEGPSDRADATSTRDAKVAAFKRGKALSAAMTRLEAAAARRREDDDGGDEEDDERELWILRIEEAALTALSQRASLSQEIQMLRFAATRDRPPGAPLRPGEKGPSDGALPQAMMASLRNAASHLEAASRAPQPRDAIADVLSQREAIRARVMAPSYNMPTVSLGEYAAMEMEEMHLREKESAERKAAEAERLSRMTADEIEDEEIAKQRGKDEFKDDNPHGWGNSKLRPCA